MITRVPVSISMGTRGTRELLMSLLVEALLLCYFRYRVDPVFLVENRKLLKDVECHILLRKRKREGG